MKSCKECPYKDCLMRTDKEFKVCPVEIAKGKYEEAKKADK